MGFFGDIYNGVKDFSHKLTGQKGYDTAAQGAREADRRFGDLANDLWGRQMEGLGKAQDQYGASNAYWGQYANAGPGQMENWYDQYGGQFTRDPNSQSAYNGVQTFMNNPTWAQGTFGNSQPWMQGPSSSREMQGTLDKNLQGPGQSTYAYGTNQPMYTQKGSGEQRWQDTQNQYSGRSNAGDVYDLYSGQLAGPGRSEGFNVDQNAITGNLDQFAGNIEKKQGTAQVEKSAGELQGLYRGANMGGNYAQSQRGALEGPGIYEQMITNDIMGHDPAHQMNLDEGTARINQEMARRGQFNSGGANTAMGKFIGQEQATDYNNRTQRAAQAEGLQLARIGQGTQTMAAGDQSRLGQGNALQGLAGQRDTELRSRLDQQLNAYNSASQAQLGAQGLAMNAAGQADNAKLARLMGMSGMASAGDQSSLAYLTAGQQAANSAQGLGLQRGRDFMTAAGQVDESDLARNKQRFDMTQGADASDLAKFKGNFDMSRELDRGDLDKQRLNLDAAGQLDDQTLKRLLGFAGVAGQAQGARDDRMGRVMGARSGIDSGIAGLIAQMYGQGGQQYGGAMGDSINAGANAYGLQGQGQNSGSRFAQDLLKFLMPGAPAPKA